MSGSHGGTAQKSVFPRRGVVGYKRAAELKENEK
jgi:hypothetical protein